MLGCDDTAVAPYSADEADAEGCLMCGLTAPCECDPLRLAGAAEVTRMIEQGVGR